MNQKVIVVALVVVILVAIVGIAAFALIQERDEDGFQTESTALVYGNANMDHTIDASDVELIQSIIDEEVEWNSNEQPFVDANVDGVIDQEDVDLVNKIINQESCTVYYYDYWGAAESLQYPISNPKIAVTFWPLAEAVGILGLWDNIVVANYGVSTSSATAQYDHSDIIFVGTTVSSTTVSDENIEVMLDNDVDLIIANGNTTIQSACASLKNVGVQSIILENNGYSTIPTILTLGVLLNAEEEAQKYVAYCEDIVDTITERVEGNKKTAILTMMYENQDNYIASDGGICTFVNNVDGAPQLISYIVDLYEDTPTNVAQGRAYFSVEWFMENDDKYDYIIIMEQSTGLDGTKDNYNQRFETSLTYLEQTAQYANETIVGTTYSFGGFSGYAMLMLVAWMVYPDLFTEDEALGSMQYFYDEFTTADVNVYDLGYHYTGTEFTPEYLRD